MTRMTQVSRFAAMAALAGMMLAGCGGKDGADAPKAAGPAMPPPAEVEVVRVHATELHRTAKLPGRLEASRTAQVRARVEGIVEKQFCVEGSMVKAGDLLFRIDASRLAADADLARATLGERKADAAVAAQTLARIKELVKTGAVSAQQFDEAQARKQQSDAAVAAAQAAVRRAEVELGYAEVRAPISGHLGRAQVTEGALVGKNEATLLITIEQTDPIRVNFAQSSADYLKFRDQMLGEFKPGKKPVVILVQMMLEDLSIYPKTGKLTFADVVIDTAMGAVGMRADFPNPDERLLPGQFVAVGVQFQSTEQALALPQRAVQASPAGQYVYRVIADNKVESVPVELGGLSGDQWIIGKGLAEGDVVIVNGVQKVRPGAVVKPVGL